MTLDSQRRNSHLELVAAGALPARVPVDLQQALFEDDNIYHIDIVDNGTRLGVFFRVGAWQCDYFPTVSYGRALTLANSL